jgi:hypothetical protein
MLAWLFRSVHYAWVGRFDEARNSSRRQVCAQCPHRETAALGGIDILVKMDIFAMALFRALRRDWARVALTGSE